MTTSWGSGFSAAEWIVNDYRKGIVHPLAQLFGKHEESCDVDHVISRLWLFERPFFESLMYYRALKSGYEELALHWLIMSPGGDAIGRQLGDEAGIVCLEFTGQGDWDAIDQLDETLFGAEPAWAILRLTGPFPATTTDVKRSLTSAADDLIVETNMPDFGTYD
jgi:hypothetical protein